MPESSSGALFDHPADCTSLHLKTPDSRGADLAFVRPMRRSLTTNLLKMNRLALCPHKVEILGLLRPSCVGNPTPFPTTHNLHPAATAAAQRT